MAESNTNSAPPNTSKTCTTKPSTPSNTNQSPSKPTKIVLKRVLEINDNLKLHLYGTQLIVEAGLMLNIPQITISKAQIIYHRFYYNKNRDLMDYPPFHIAMTCTYLASKIDENTRRHRDILTVFDRLYKKRNSSNKTHLRTIDPHGKRYSIWKENLFNFEIRVLAAMGFNCCSFDSSHKYLLQVLVDLLATQHLAKQSWALLNDLHRLPNILDYTCLEIACSCIFLAARRLKIKLPDDPSWCDLFGVNKVKLSQIASIILELLELPKHAFKPPSCLKEDDETLDCNPQTVKKQIKVIHKRNLDKHKRIKAAKLKNQRHHTVPIKSNIKSTATNSKKMVLPKLVTVPKPILGHQQNGKQSKVNGIKKINLKIMGKLTPPNTLSSISSLSQSIETKTIHFSSNSHQFTANNNNNNNKSLNNDKTDINIINNNNNNNNKNDTKVDAENNKEKETEKDKEKNKDNDNDIDITMNDKSKNKEKEREKDKDKEKEKDKDKDRNRKSHRSRDRDRERERRRERDRDRRRRRDRERDRSSRRRHKSRRDRDDDDGSSSDSDYHQRYRDRHCSRRHRSRRDRDRDRDRERTRDRDRDRERDRDRSRRDRSASYSESSIRSKSRSMSKSKSKSKSRSRSRSRSPSKQKEKYNKRSRSRSKQKDTKKKTMSQNN